MAVIQIENPTPAKGFALFNLGFRPFFLLAGSSAVILMLLWLMTLTGKQLGMSYYPGHYWHSHELLFGYTTAVIIGFLLTAIRNWTGIETLKGPALSTLALVWLTGRITPFITDSGLTIAAVDLAFLLLGATAAAYPILKVKQYKNLVFTPILIGLWIANLLTHLQLNGMTEFTLEAGQRLAVGMITMIMVVMGTRVIPFFIERGTGTILTLKRWPKIETIGNLSVLLWLIASTTLGDRSQIAGAMSLIAGLLLSLRVYGWYTSAIWRVPMLWILFLGALWLPLGLLMKSLVAVDLVANSYATHAFTTGAIGCLTMGMMSRVTLGHTGRSIEHSGLTLIAFICLAITPFLRLLPALPYLAAKNIMFLHLSGSLWVIGFLLFVVQYAPMLVKPRLDGKPG